MEGHLACAELWGGVGQRRGNASSLMPSLGCPQAGPGQQKWAGTRREEAALEAPGVDPSLQTETQSFWGGCSLAGACVAGLEGC